MGSARYVARRITFGSVTLVVVVFAGIVAAFGDASIAVVDHGTSVCHDHHRFVLGSEGPDQRVHVVLHPPRQVTTNGLRYGGNGGIEVEVGEGVSKMAEDTGERTPKQAPASLFHKLASPIRPGFQARHHVGEEDQMVGIVIRVGVVHSRRR